MKKMFPQKKSEPPRKSKASFTKDAKEEYAGQKTLKIEQLTQACEQLKKDYETPLQGFSTQINTIKNLVHENISLLKKQNLAKDETAEALADDTILTLTDQIGNLQKVEDPLNAIITELEKSKKKLMIKLNTEATLEQLDKYQIDHDKKKSKFKFKVSTKFSGKSASYQYLKKELQNNESRDIDNQKTSPRNLQEELDKNVRKTIPEDLRGDFDALLELWKEKTKSVKLQNKEEKVLEENPKRGMFHQSNQ